MIEVRRTFLIVLVCASSSLLGAESGKELATVGLEQAKKYAIEHNYEVMALRHEVEEATAKIQKARAPYYPKLGVVGGADTHTQINTSTVGFAQGELNLFSGFEDSRRLRVAELEQEKAQIRLKRAGFRVGLEVERQFHLFLFKKSAIELKADALKINETQQKMAKQRRSGGMGSDSDILEFDLRESLLQSDLHSLQQELEEARVNLKRLLGEEIGSKIEPSGKLQHQHVTESLMDLVRRMRNDNESVLIAEKDLAVADVESNLWLSKWLPRIDVKAQVGYLPYDLRQAPGTAAAAGIYARWDFFSGFETSAERKEAVARQLRTEARMRDAILSAITQMEVAYRKIITVQERVDLESKNLDRAKRYYESVRSEYRRGLKNSVDLKVAAELLFDTKVRRNGYKYEFLNQRIELERALGSSVATAMEKEED